ncbi:MAG: type I methionyl aminopeptidase [bacterium]|nr:type I methionyl aminopeptidase [bacterium]
MITIKTKKQIEIMVQGGKILSDVVHEIVGKIKPGVSELEIDKMTQDLIIKRGAEPAFKMVKGYKHTICSTTNNVVVHGIPSEYRYKEGDIAGIDCGALYRGFYTDMADAVRVTTINHQQLTIDKYKAIDLFLQTGKRALEEAIKVTVPGNRIGNISEVIQNIVENSGYSVVRSLVGHGVGKKLHEEPEIPGFIDRDINKTPLLKEGMTLAIEVIYNMGKSDVVYKGNDHWSIVTKDGSLSAVFEKTIAITKKEPVILTK